MSLDGARLRENAGVRRFPRSEEVYDFEHDSIPKNAKQWETYISVVGNRSSAHLDKHIDQKVDNLSFVSMLWVS